MFQHHSGDVVGQHPARQNRGTKSVMEEYRVPSGPPISKLCPTFSKCCSIFKRKSSILRQPFFKDGYGSNLTEKFVMINIKMLKGFNSCTLASGVTLHFRLLKYARSSEPSSL